MFSDTRASPSTTAAGTIITARISSKHTWKKRSPREPVSEIYQEQDSSIYGKSRGDIGDDSYDFNDNDDIHTENSSARDCDRIDVFIEHHRGRFSLSQLLFRRKRVIPIEIALGRKGSRVEDLRKCKKQKNDNIASSKEEKEGVLLSSRSSIDERNVDTEISSVLSTASTVSHRTITAHREVTRFKSHFPSSFSSGNLRSNGGLNISRAEGQLVSAKSFAANLSSIHEIDLSREQVSATQSQAPHEVEKDPRLASLWDFFLHHQQDILQFIATKDNLSTSRMGSQKNGVQHPNSIPFSYFNSDEVQSTSRSSRESVGSNEEKISSRPILQFSKLPDSETHVPVSAKSLSILKDTTEISNSEGKTDLGSSSGQFSHRSTISEANRMNEDPTTAIRYLKNLKRFKDTLRENKKRESEQLRRKARHSSKYHPFVRQIPMRPNQRFLLKKQMTVKKLISKTEQKSHKEMPDYLLEEQIDARPVRRVCTMLNLKDVIAVQVQRDQMLVREDQKASESMSERQMEHDQMGLITSTQDVKAPRDDVSIVSLEPLSEWSWTVVEEEGGMAEDEQEEKEEQGEEHDGLNEPESKQESTKIESLCIPPPIPKEARRTPIHSPTVSELFEQDRLSISRSISMEQIEEKSVTSKAYENSDTNESTIDESSSQLNMVSPQWLDPVSPVRYTHPRRAITPPANFNRRRTHHVGQYDIPKVNFSALGILSDTSSQTSTPKTASSTSSSQSSRRAVHFTHTVQFGKDKDGKKVINEYVILNSLGKGSYGKVNLGMNKQTEEMVAIKTINKALLSKTNRDSRGRPSSRAMGFIAPLQRELAILKKVNHPNIVNLIEFIDDPTNHKVRNLAYWLCSSRLFY